MYRTIGDSLRAYREKLQEFRIRLEELGCNKKGGPGITAYSLEEWIPWVPNIEPRTWVDQKSLKEVRERYLILKGWALGLGMNSEEERRAYESAGLRVE